MGERAPYSRVYWSIVDDPKFHTIYDDDRHLAAWLRLLIAADATWPASPTLPVNSRKVSVRALAEAGLIDLLSGHRYRIHGLDSERGRRRVAATSRLPSGNHTDTERSPNGPSRTRDAILGSASLGSAPARDRRSELIYQRMMAQRIERYRETGEWPEDQWGPKPKGLAS